MKNAGITIDPPVITRTTEKRSAIIHLNIPGKDMPKFMDPAIQEILAVLKHQGLHPSGPMYSYHLRRPSDTFDFELGFPVSKEIKPRGRVVPGILPTERVARTVYQGPYEGLAQAWGLLNEWVVKEGHQGAGRFWECYLNNPDEAGDTSNYRTELNWILSAGPATA